ncbi:hypothetical protein [Klebsiella sp. BIGb0407]|uniref:hypothetical protein n=1 Tax=Klebsiella sp. BIGb0407 TaxID=2940603 RepID=UPI0021679FD4|nr:hypothetical protein [Klebsiella sp. BIGb0407]MCS3432679.1 hypothetical protein [Klebsiella sp. BIGb0407]
MRKILFFIFLTIFLLDSILFFIASSSEHFGMGFDFLEQKITYFETIQRWSILFILTTFCFSFGHTIYHDGIFKYKVSEISGIFGIIAFMISFSFSVIWPVFSWGVLIAGALCFYAISVPVINIIYEKMNGNKWEKGTVTALISFMVLYFINYKSNIIINDIFAVDPKHFYFTKFIASVIIVAPYVFVISIISLLYNIYKISKNKDDGNLFYFFTGFLASCCFLISSIAFTVGGNNIIRNVASIVDFNSKSICVNVDKSHGVIYLDDKYQLILIDKKEKGIHRYEITKCNIGI